MLKRMLIWLLVLLLTVSGMTSAVAASAGDGAISPQDTDGSGAAYAVVSAAVNREYDFKDDFHDSYLYDDDFYTEGIFRLHDYNGDITLTLRDNATGEEFVYEKNSQTEWIVEASVDHLLYETAQIDAAVHIYDLGDAYGITEMLVPVTITVISSLYSADYHKYPSYDCSYTSMREGEDFSVEYDASASDGKATVRLLKEPRLFFLRIYNVETREAEYYEPGEAVFEFPTEIEADGFDPSKNSFWFFIPGKLLMDDGYVFEFILSVNGKLHAAADDTPATIDEAAEDEAAPDEATGDEATPDEATGDEATPDEPAGDESTPDEATGDEATPDEPAGDESIPDEATGEEATPDEATGDEATPDEATEDEAAPDEPATPDQVLVGDIDGDGDVDNRDAMILDRFIAGWVGYDRYIDNMRAADTDGDGDVDNRDAMILDRYAAGWVGYDAYIVSV